MKIVIEVPDDEYKQIMERHVNMCSSSDMFIRNGTVLPKGHGRLIDAYKLDTRVRGNNSQRTMWREIDYIVRQAPTIVEADKESEDDR